VARKRGSLSAIFSTQPSSIFWVMSSLLSCIAATEFSMAVSNTALSVREHSSAMCKRSQMSSVVLTKCLFDFRVRCASQSLSLSPMKSVKNVEKESVKNGAFRKSAVHLLEM
jgi:hypothetical protein